MSGQRTRGKAAGSPPEEGQTSAAITDDPNRKKGEIPHASAGADIRDGLRRLAGVPITQRERLVARYLDRLSVPMLELDDVTGGFDAWSEISDACVKVLGYARSHDLAIELGYAARRVMSVAHALGYEPADDE